jgi:hypothetical protein
MGFPLIISSAPILTTEHPIDFAAETQARLFS